MMRLVLLFTIILNCTALAAFQCKFCGLDKGNYWYVFGNGFKARNNGGNIKYRNIAQQLKLFFFFFTNCKITGGLGAVMTCQSNFGFKKKTWCFRVDNMVGSFNIGIVNTDNRFYVSGQIGDDFSAWWEGDNIYVNNLGTMQQVTNAGSAIKKGNKVCVYINNGFVWWTKNGKATKKLKLPTSDKRYVGSMLSRATYQQVSCVKN